MNKQKRSLLVLAGLTVFVGVAVFLPGLIGAGNLEPPGPPDSTMRTLDEIYDQLAGLHGKMDFSLGRGGRFDDLGNGTVRDNFTNLIWLKNANCFGSMNWEGARAAAAGLNDGECGLSDGSTEGDWRLPTIEEFPAILDKHYSNPALSDAAGTGQWREGDAFNNVQFFPYWSSTEYEDDSLLAWSVYLNFGVWGKTGKATSGFVWPVRGGN